MKKNTQFLIKVMLLACALGVQATPGNDIFASKFANAQDIWKAAPEKYKARSPVLSDEQKCLWRPQEDQKKLQDEIDQFDQATRDEKKNPLSLQDTFEQERKIVSVTRGLFFQETEKKLIGSLRSEYKALMLLFYQDEEQRQGIYDALDSLDYAGVDFYKEYLSVNEILIKKTESFLSSYNIQALSLEEKKCFCRQLNIVFIPFLQKHVERIEICDQINKMPAGHRPITKTVMRIVSDGLEQGIGNLLQQEDGLLLHMIQEEAAQPVQSVSLVAVKALLDRAQKLYAQLRGQMEVG